MASSFLAGNNLILPLLAGLIPLFLGLALTAVCLGNLRRPAAYLLILSLAPGFGLAITSVLYFIWICLYQPKFEIGRYMAIEGILLVILFLVCGIFWMLNRRKFQTFNLKAKPTQFRFNFIMGISIAGAVTLFLALIAFLNNWQISAYAHPDGDWDAWAIWNLRARFIFAGEQWKDGFNAAISWSHPDYPLLLPGSIARIWVMLSSSTQAVPILVNLLFTLSILAVMLAGLALTRGWKTAIFAGLFTLPVLQVSLGFMQYADMPLAFFFLAANLLLFLIDGGLTDLLPRESSFKQPSWNTKLLRIARKKRDLSTENQRISARSENYSVLILVGLATGAALWTKNEGWAFLIALGVSEILRILVDHYRLQDMLKRWVYFIIGFTPFFAAVMIYKSMVNIPVNLLSGILNQDIVAKLFDLSRYWIIGKTFLEQFYSYGSLRLPLIPLLIIYMLVVGINIRKHERTAILTQVVRVGFIAVIYFAIYLLTPSSLEWHLTTSLTRLVSQLLPSVILIVFLCSRSIEEYEYKGSGTLTQ
jgi:uncharacterized membrane protein YwzB